MIPDLEAVGSPAPAETTGTPTPLRLRLDPNGPIEPYLDGAWWPHSHELRVELSALLATLSADLGPIALVGYHRDAWELAPDRLDLAGHPIHLVGFGSPNPPTLIVIADTGRRVTLRVVAPETDGRVRQRSWPLPLITPSSNTPQVQTTMPAPPNRARWTSSLRGFPGCPATPRPSGSR
jgi:Family of unknown function (DUF5994)